ncbi:hypothetical protein D3C76_1200390 [compost metagenome]
MATEAGRQCDDGVQIAMLEQILAQLFFSTFTEQHGIWNSDHDTALGLSQEVLDMKNVTNRRFLFKPSP